jgi:LmbE family N-acetylglucosaminyl deacetylase
MDHDQSLTLLVVLAHPDDETLGMGSVISYYASESVKVHLLTATRGERGWFGVPEPNPGLQALGILRERELENAARVLGISSVSMLSYVDGELDQADPLEASGHISNCLRQVRPQVVVTFSPDGHYGHPDHIAISQLTHAALLRAADPNDLAGSGLPPHRVSKFYYLVDSRRLVKLVETVFGGVSMDVDGVIRSHFGWEEWMLSCRIPVGEHWRTAWKAILCHQTQLPNLRALADLDEKILAALLSDGAFYRVFSLVNGGRQLENDLFAGLR